MDTTTATPETPSVLPSQPVLEPSSAETPTESVSISEHAAQFDPHGPKVEPLEGETVEEAKARVRDDQGRFASERRHRAQSQKATAEDVGRIGTLTKKWRAEETSRKALEEKYAALEREVQTLKTPKVEPPKAPASFGDTEPKIEDYAASDDPYRDYMRALAAFDRKREAAEEAKARHEAESQQYQQKNTAEQEAEWQRIGASYEARVNEFTKHRPDFLAVVGAIKELPPPVLHYALILDDRGPEFVYTLASRPSLLAELSLMAEGKELNERNVALMRRLLTDRVQPVATTGSTAVTQSTYLPPKPPNPVRTGPIKATDEPPGDTASIAEHARYYGKR